MALDSDDGDDGTAGTPKAVKHIDELRTMLVAWKTHLVKKEETFKAHEAASQGQSNKEEDDAPPVEFSVNVTKRTPCSNPSTPGSTVRIQFIGKVLKTKKIAESSFHTGSVPKKVVIGDPANIEGWNKGLLGACPGDRRTIVVPFGMAYGEAGRPPAIGKRADLEYFVEIVEVSGGGGGGGGGSSNRREL